MRLYRLLACAVTLAVTAATAHAQTWNNYTGTPDTNWSTAANWVGGVAPVSGPNTSLTFTTTPPQTVPPAPGFQPTGNYTSTNDATTLFSVHQIFFDGYGSPSTSTPGITITSNVATGGISFQGTNPLIIQNGSGSVLFDDGAAASDLQLTNNLGLVGNGSGHLILAGTITGSGNLNIAQNGGTPLFTGAQVMLTPSAATPNTFTGAITLQAGNLVLGSVGNPLGNINNLVTIQGGSLRGIGNAVFIPNPINLANRLTLTGTQSFVFSNTVGGGGGIRVAYYTLNSATFQAPITGGGDIIVEGLGSTQNSFVLNANGTATATTSYTVNFGNFTISNATNLATPRLNSNASLNLGNASFTMFAGTAGVTNESVSATNLDGAALITLTPTTTRAVQLFGGALSRMNKATFQVNTTGVGLTLGGAPGLAGNATLQFDNLAIADNINGVLPFGFAMIQNGPAAGDTAQTFVRYDTNSGIVPLNLTTDYVSNTTVAFNTIGLTPGVNYRLGLPKNTVEGSTNNPRINSLLIEANGTAASNLGGAIYGTGTIQLTSGALATTLVGGNSQPTFLGTAISKNIDFGPQGFLHAHANTALLGNLSGVNGFVKAGSGSLLLTGTNSTLMGLTINNGSVSFSRDANLGGGTGAITLGAGQGTGALVFSPNSQFETPASNSVSTNRLTTLTSGAGSLSVALSNTTLSWNGTILGPGRLMKTGPGTLELTGNNNYFGDTTILSGAVSVATDNSLGSFSAPISNVVLAGSTASAAALLQTTASFTSNRNLLITSTTTGANAIFTSTNATLTLTGNIGGSQPDTPFLKIGIGTLVLSGRSSINGAITLGDTIPVRRPSALVAQPGGTIVLSDLGGSLAAGTSYTLNSGTMLTLDNSVTPNFNRISSSSITANGAELRFIGNGSGSTFEHIGLNATAGFISNSLGNTITLEQPAGSPVSANLVITGLTPTGITFFRGSNLGSPGSGGFTRIIFATAPPLHNGLITGSFFANTATGDPTDFATYVSSTNGVEALPPANYVPFPVAGGNNGNTNIATGTITVTGPVASNAVKLSSSTIVLGANTLSLAGNAGLILSTADDTITGGTIAFGSTPARISSNSTLTITSNITTSGGLNKFGHGVLAISATTVTGGGYHVSQGTLRLTSAAAFSNNQALTLAVDANFDLGSNGTPATPVVAANITGFGNIDIGSGALANAASVDTPTAYGGGFLGNGTFIHNFTGSPPANTPTYNGHSPEFVGSVQLLGGSLILDSATAFGTSGTIQLGNTTGSQSVTLTLGAGVTQFNKNFNVPLGSSGTVTLSTGPGNRVSMLTGTFTIGRPLTLVGAGSNTAHVPGATTLAGLITDNGGQVGSLNWTGGNYSLSAANTFTGGVTVNANAKNVLGLGHNSALGTGTITIANSASTGSFRADGGPRSIANNFTFAPGTTANTIGFVGVNDLTFTSPVVNLGSATRTFEVISLGKTTFTSQFIGTSTLNKTGAGTLKFTSNTSTFSGGFVLTAGKLAFGASSVGFPTVIRGPIGTGPLTIAGCDIVAEDGPQDIDNTVMVMADFTIEGMNDITMGGIISIGTSTRRIIVTNTGATNFTNVISGTGAAGVIKDGPGSLTFFGDNTTGYPGGTTVMDGVLQINSQTGSGLPVSGMTEVMTGGTLEGNGKINSDLTIQAGGKLGGGVANSPSVGTLTSNGGNITVNTNATMKIGITVTGTASALDSGGSSGGSLGSPANNNFFQKTAGTFTVQPGAKLEVDLGGAAFSLLGVNYSYNIMQIQGPQIGAFAPGDVSFVNASGFAFQNITVSTGASGMVFLNFTPTPEPAAILAIAAVSIGLLRRRRA